MVRIILNCLIAIFLPGCISQQYIPAQELYPGQIAIVNETDDTVEFFIGEEAEELYNVSILAGEQWISPVFSGRPFVRIIRDQVYGEYLLVPGLFYRIYPDPRKKRPDIKMITRKQVKN